jgi:hypothetical protein
VFRNDGFDPLLIETNTSTEHWQKGASLLVTDPLGQRDIDLPANSRVYLITGTQHTGNAGMQSTLGSCVNPRNPHNPNPALRALLVALDEWVSEGKAPPASVTPRIKDGTFVTADKLKFPAIPGLHMVKQMNDIRLLKDWIKPDVDDGEAVRRAGAAGRCRRQRDFRHTPARYRVPLATHTGWNLYKSAVSRRRTVRPRRQLASVRRHRAEREAKNDRVPSLEERYGSHAGYVRRVEEAARLLVPSA